MTNAYPEKPLLPYKKTTVEMAIVIASLKALVADQEVKRMSYVLFRNESANGTKGINNNYCGFQADSGRWTDNFDSEISGVVSRTENGTGKQRLFLAFNDVKGCLDMLTERVQGRGLYIGGITHKIWKDQRIDDVNELCRAYQKEWVKGSVNAEPTEAETKNFVSMYNQAAKLFT